MRSRPAVRRRFLPFCLALGMIAGACDPAPANEAVLFLPAEVLGPTLALEMEGQDIRGKLTCRLEDQGFEVVTDTSQALRTAGLNELNRRYRIGWVLRLSVMREGTGERGVLRLLRTDDDRVGWVHSYRSATADLRPFTEAMTADLIGQLPGGTGGRFGFGLRRKVDGC